MKKRAFLKAAGALASVTLLPSSVWAIAKNGKIRTAHIGVGGMGGGDLKVIASHDMVEVTALCDVDSVNLAAAQKSHPGAKAYRDYRRLFDEVGKSIDAVIVSTPDHTHAPASMRAMEMGKAVYCQKPLTHHVSEARAMKEMTQANNLVTQMGIQKHSSDPYLRSVVLIQQGLIGKVSCVRAWSPKNWGYDGAAPSGSDPVPENLDWNLWLGTAPERAYKENYYHPGNWRKLLDYGCGTLGDMGVHIFDTPYTALGLTVPKTVNTSCREFTGFGHPENNVVTYEFPGTAYTTDNFKWVWYDGPGAPDKHEDLILPNNDKLPDQGAIFVGEKGTLVLPHCDYPKLIVNGKYEKIDFPDMDLVNHYHQFIDTCLGKDSCSAPFSYAANLTEAILLGVVANRFPNQTLHWNGEKGKFKEKEPNKFLKSKYRKF